MESFGCFQSLPMSFCGVGHCGPDSSDLLDEGSDQDNLIIPDRSSVSASSPLARSCGHDSGHPRKTRSNTPEKKRNSP